VSSPSADAGADAAGEARALIGRIEATFGRDLPGWLACFAEPFVLVAGGAPVVVPDHEAGAARFGPLFESLRAAGFASTEATSVEVDVLDGDVATVDASFRRLRADGTVMEELAAFYVCHRSRGKGGGWAVTVLVPHGR
jgi:ketosteroid isomerase-like protein